MPLSLLYEWLAFYRLEPWGYEAELARWQQTEYRHFTRTAIATANILNGLKALRGRPGGRSYKIRDFIPDFAKPKKPAFRAIAKQHTPEELTKMYQGLKMALGLVGIKPKKRDDADD